MKELTGLIETDVFDIGFVVPFFNEAESVRDLIAALDNFVRNNDFRTQFIFVDDGSTDETLNLLRSAILKNKKIVVHNSNYGHQNALSTGLREVNAKFVITMDADLQHPIDLVSRMIQEIMTADFDVVQTYQSQRKEGSFFKRILAILFWESISVSDSKFIKNTGDFRIINKATVERINLIHDPKVLRFIIPKICSKIKYIPFEAAPRMNGKTKYSLKKMLSLALDSYLQISVAPLRFIAFSGLILSVAAFLQILFVVYSYFHSDITPGWSSVISVTLALGGLNLLSLSIIGEYILRIYRKTYNLSEITVTKIYE